MGDPVRGGSEVTVCDPDRKEPGWEPGEKPREVGLMWGGSRLGVWGSPSPESMSRVSSAGRGADLPYPGLVTATPLWPGVLKLLWSCLSSASWRRFQS